MSEVISWLYLVISATDGRNNTWFQDILGDIYVSFLNILLNYNITLGYILH